MLKTLGRLAVAFGVIAASFTVSPSARAQTPDLDFQMSVPSGTPEPSAFGASYSYAMAVTNSGTVPLDNPTMIDSLPVELRLSSVTTGAYAGVADFVAGEGVRVSYEKNTAPGVFTPWGSSPNAATNTTLTAPPPGLGIGEHIIRIRWEFGQLSAGGVASVPPRITGQVLHPDNIGGPVVLGNSIQNCATFSAMYVAGPTPVNQNSCKTYVLGGNYNTASPPTPPTPVPLLDHAALVLLSALLGAGGLLLVWRRFG